MDINGQLLSRLESIESRLEQVEKSITTINHELGTLDGTCEQMKISISSVVKSFGERAQKPNLCTMELIFKWVVFPLLFIVGALVGIKLFLP